MRKLGLGLLTAATVLAGQAAVAAPVEVTFSGVIPRVNSYFSYTNSVYDTYTASQQNFFNGFGWNSDYSFTFRYDTAATGTAGVYNVELVSGHVGSSNDFAGYNITMTQNSYWGYQMMEFQIGLVENFSPTSNFYTYLTFSLSDYGNQFYTDVNSLKDEDLTPYVDAANAEFRIARNQSGNTGYRYYKVGPSWGIEYSSGGSGQPGTGDDDDDDNGNTGGTGNPGDPTTVPAPASLALLGLGLLALGRRRFA